MSVIVLLLSVLLHAPQDGAYTPRAGTAERKAILDAIRAELDVKSQFEVTYLRANRGWAYLRAGEVVWVEGERQETDLDVAALLHSTGTPERPAWRIVEMWTLSTDHERPFRAFAARLDRRRAAERIPADIFPKNLLAP